MQKLNGREIYVLCLLALLTIILSVGLTLELVSAYSSLRTEENGSVSINKRDLIGHVNTLLQVLLGLAAFILILRKRRLGWIIALPLLLLYTLAFSIALSVPLLAGIYDITFAFGAGVVTIFLLGIVFLLLPSTIRKFNIRKQSIVPVVVLFGLLAAIYFIV